MNKYKVRRFVCNTLTLVAVISGGLAALAYDFSTADAKDVLNDTDSNVEITPINTDVTTVTTTEVNIEPEAYICPMCGQETYSEYSSFTINDINLLSALVELEAGTENMDCKKAVASVVLNRMVYKDMSLNEVIFEENQFSVADRVHECKPSKESINAVREVLSSGVTLPEYVTFFRAGYYHSWGDQIPYIQYGNTYFSYSAAVKEQFEK